MRTPFVVRARAALLLAALGAAPAPAWAWFDATHMAVLAASGSAISPCVAIVPDALAVKVPAEALNHYAAADAPLTAAAVLAEAERYDRAEAGGHLYGAVVGACRALRARLRAGLRPDYAYGFLAHYVGDLSQPLHNVAYDAFNRAQHLAVDGIVDADPALRAKIEARMRPLALADEAGLAAAVAQLANRARAADAALRRGAFDADAALDLLAGSASLLRAVDAWLGLPGAGPRPAAAPAAPP